MAPLFQVLLVKGSDAASFLQGQLTQDLARLPDAASLPAAWCNPRGRVISVVRMLQLDGGIGLVLPGELAEPVVRRLSVYRLRAKVSLELAEPDWKCLAVASDDDLAALDTRGLRPERRRHATRRGPGIVTVDTGAARQVVEVYGTTGALAASGLSFSHPLADSAWQQALIDAGYPTIVTVTSEQYTPHMLNLDRLGGVSFDKGCYTGQEIVARTEHLGSSRRRLMHYRLEAGSAAIGDPLEFDGGEAGRVLNAANRDLLTVVPVELHGETLLAGGRRALPVALPYSLPARERDPRER